MAIIQDSTGRIFTLHTKNTSYQMKIDDYGYLLHLYYGKNIGEADMSYLIQRADRGFSGNPYEAKRDKTYSLDTLPQEFPSAGVGDYRVGCISLLNSDGSWAVDLKYQKHEILAGKYSISGMPAVYGSDHCPGETLKIYLRDSVTGLEVILLYGVMESLDLITRTVQIVNGGNGRLRLDQIYSACLDLMYGDWDLIHFYGRHTMERMTERSPLVYGEQSVGSTRGTSSHHHNPFLILCDRNAGEDHGDCYGMSFVYSGNFKASVEKDSVSQVRVVMGIHPEGFCFHLEPGESFQAPEVVMTFSSEGFDQLSRNYHKAYRYHLCRGKYRDIKRPVLINNWEATYFDFTSQKLIDIAKSAVDLGIEMLVMDDGWYGKREEDCSGLGDWFVNEEKLPGGLRPLAAEVNRIGLKFGIWLEPEMISEDSDLYRTHPDWALIIPGRRPVRSRHQLVLDMSREDVREYLYASISAVLSSANIEYVKWDMNRSIADIYSHQQSKEGQGEVSHRFVLGLYDLLERLVTRFPDILFEGCSGGGGRFDPAMLYYSPQIWCSDNTDAIDRLKIQYGTSFGYPISAIGAHVSASPNHQNGRVTPMATRGITAMAGSFGFELDLCSLDEEEKAVIRRQTKEYKEFQDLIYNGNYYRLTNPFENAEYTAWQFASEDQKEALVHLVSTRVGANPPPMYLRLKGLDPEKIYRINKEKEMSGRALMNGGLAILPKSKEFTGYQFYLEEKV